MQCEHHYPGWILRAPPNPRPCSEQPMIQRQLTSEALNSAQMLEVCVLWHGGGGGHIPKEKLCFLPFTHGRNKMHPEVAQAQMSTSLLSCPPFLHPQLPDLDLERPDLLSQTSSHLPLHPDLRPSSPPTRPTVLLPKSPPHPYLTWETTPQRPRGEGQPPSSRAKIRTSGS